MVQPALTSWNPSWRALQNYLSAVHCLLKCIDETASGRSKLDPSQEEDILSWGGEALSRVHQWLRDLEWHGLHVGCLRGTVALADSIYAATFPHIASYYFVTDVVDPLIDLCSTARGRDLVTKELVSAVESAWSSARVAYPDAMNPSEGAKYIWCSGLDRIDARLVVLRAAVS